MKKISLVIPTLNEAANIKPLFAKIANVQKEADFEIEIVVVDDGSIDGTRQEVLQYHIGLNVRLVCRDNERGLSTAVVAGALEASSDIIVVMDADLSHPVEIISLLARPLLDNSHDMVIGSRYVPGGDTPDWPMVRRLGSRVASLPAQLLTSVKDPLAGFFAVRKSLILDNRAKMSGFKIGLEILAGTDQTLRVAEVPISFKDRYKGASKMNSAVLYEYAKQLYRLTTEGRRLKVLLSFITLACLAGFLDTFLFSALTAHGYSLGSGHVASFLLSTNICYFLSFFIKKKTKDNFGREYLNFLLFVILGMYLQDGVLAISSFSETIGTPFSNVFLISSSALLWLVATVTAARSNTQNRTITGISLFIICYTVLLRLLYIGGPELIQEEAYYWNYAQHMAAGYLDHPPVVALLIKVGTFFFGDNEFGVRIGALACWFVTAVFMYRLTKQIFDKKNALRVLALVATLPIFFGTSVVITPDAPLIASWAGALYFLYLALVKKQTNAWYSLGVILGIGFASKYSIVFLGPAIISYLLVDKESRRWFFKPQPYLAVVIALIVASPVFFWNYQHNWISFLFQSQQRIQNVYEFTTPLLLFYIVILLSPIGFLSVVSLARPLFLGKEGGVRSNLKIMQRETLFCMIMGGVPLAIIVFFSLTREVKLNWTGPLWLSFLPLMAYAMAQNNSRLQSRVTKMWPNTLMILILVYGAVLHYGSLGLPGIPFTGGNLLLGWNSLAQQVEKTVEKAEVANGQAPLVVGLDKYRIASGLVFYGHKLMLDRHVTSSDIYEATGRQVLGANALMYNYWLPAERATGRDLLLVSQYKSDIENQQAPLQYEKNPKIGEYIVTKHGKNVGSYYYTLLTTKQSNIAFTDAPSTKK